MIKSKNIIFIDTCIISQALQDLSIMRQLMKYLVRNQCWCGISTKTLSELHKKRDLFVAFQKYIGILPFFLIKPSKILISEEANNLGIKGGSNIHPIFISLTDQKNNLLKLTEEIVSIVDQEFPKGAKSIVVDHIKSLMKNYPPKNGNKYTKDEIIEFCDLLTLQQLNEFHQGAIRTLRKSEVKPSVFLSLRSQALITFWKFYKFKDRKARDSDVFDISMSSCFPYVDFILTEKNMASDILQIKKSGFAYSNLKGVKTIKDFKVIA